MNNDSQKKNAFTSDLTPMAHCVACGRTVESWHALDGNAFGRSAFGEALDAIGSDLSRFWCPHCRSTDRDRHLILYLDAVGATAGLAGADILHIAPEAAISSLIRQRGPRRYVRGDLQPAADDIERIDLETLPFANASFDYVICNHVLEHVHSVARALAEVARVLRPGGRFVCQTPYARRLTTTFEDPELQSEADRVFFYGQNDHVRRFGRDIGVIIRDSGFRGTLRVHAEVLSEIDGAAFGVNEHEPFFDFVRDATYTATQVAGHGVATTPATPPDCHDMVLPDQALELAAIDDSGTLAGKPVGDQLRLLRSYRRALRPGGSLRVEVADTDARAALIDRARYAGFTDAHTQDDSLVLHVPDQRLAGDEIPLVTIAIPAFKPAHFAACLDSALAQTYPHLQILVCDDSRQNKLRQIADTRPSLGHNIEWVDNQGAPGGSSNFILCIERARGDFIKFLCDDDLLEPDCVERMVAAFRRDPDATLVFSRRQRIDVEGMPLPDDQHSEALAPSDCVFRGEMLAGAVIALQCNFIGEPTTVMFRRADLAWIRPHYATFDGHDDIRVVNDIAAWHNLLSQGEAVYIARPLSRFRIHPGQNQARPEIRDLAAASWAKLETGSQKLGFMQVPHPLVPHRTPGSRVWRLDPELPLNRRLATRAWGEKKVKAPVNDLAKKTIRLIDAILTPEANTTPEPAAPTAAHQRYEQAAALMGTGRTEEGANALIALASEQVPIWEVYADLAEFALTVNDRQAALDLMLTAAQLTPNTRQVALGAARLQTEIGEFEPALASLSPYLRKQPNDNDALALVRSILGKSPELSAIAWARLLADLRCEASTMRTTLAQYRSALEQLLTEAKLASAAARHNAAALYSTTLPCKDGGAESPIIAGAQITHSNAFMAALGYLSTNNLTGFKWFADEVSYQAWDKQLETVQTDIERYITAHEQFPGYCGLCEQATVYTVSSGLQLDGHTHLREGMRCAHCGTHNRGRVLGLAIKGSKSLRTDTSDVLLMEATTPLYDHLSARLPNLVGTEFQSSAITGGGIIDVGGRKVRHENILKLSYPDESLDIIAHADLLEHVPDVETALRECHRALRNGGELIFSAPFHPSLKTSRKRAELLASGDIQHFVPAEYHGPHLAYYNFGWNLLDMCRGAGFSRVQIGVCFDPLQGLLSTGRFGGYFMQPIVFSCVR